MLDDLIIPSVALTSLQTWLCHFSKDGLCMKLLGHIGPMGLRGPVARWARWKRTLKNLKLFLIDYETPEVLDNAEFCVFVDGRELLEFVEHPEFLHFVDGRK